MTLSIRVVGLLLVGCGLAVDLQVLQLQVQVGLLGCTVPKLARQAQT